jgi:hypothetical protein
MDKITICNMALAYIGESPIESLSENSEQARRCAQFYEHDRRFLLRRYSWPWARRRVELAQLAYTPEDYDYAYRYPSNCICLRKVYSVGQDGSLASDSVEYIIASDDQGRAIYCDAPRVLVEYTADLDDTDIMDEQFCEVLAWKIASSMAFKLVGQPELTKMATEQFERLCQEAVASVINEQNNGLEHSMDKTTICNMALSHIGEPPIESIAEVSEQARRCAQFYEHDRRLVLRRYPWPWATRRVALTKLEDSPQDYRFAYRYPSDCVCLRKLYALMDNGKLAPLSDFLQYRIVSDDDGQVLYCNAPSVVAEYTADISDNDLMDEQFCEVLSWKLAASIASKLVGDARAAQMATMEYERLYNDAVANATNEENTETPELNTFIRARF